MTIICTHCQNPIDAAAMLAHGHSCSHCGAGHGQDVLTVSTPASPNSYEISRDADRYTVSAGGQPLQTFDTLPAAFDYIDSTDYPLALVARFEEYAAGFGVTIDTDTLDADTVRISADGTNDDGRPVAITARIVPPADTADGLGFADHVIVFDYDAEEAAFLATLDGAQRDMAAAVIAQLGDFESFAESAADIAAYGAPSGWSGFIYYADTVPFAVRNLRAIRDYGRELADDIGADGFYSLVAGFNCLDLTTDDVADAMHDSDHDSHTEVMNALAWFALEEAARIYDDWTDRGRP